MCLILIEEVKKKEGEKVMLQKRDYKVGIQARVSVDSPVTGIKVLILVLDCFAVGFIH